MSQISARMLSQQVDNLRAQNKNLLDVLQQSIDALRKTNQTLLEATNVITGRLHATEPLIEGDETNAHPPREFAEEPG